MAKLRFQNSTCQKKFCVNCFSIPKKIISIKDKSGEVTTSFTYSENKVVVKGEEENTYTLKNGRATQFSYAYNGKVYLNGECVYSGDYLSKTSQKDIEDGDEYVENYTFKNGNLEKYVVTTYGEDEGEKYEEVETYEFTYGKQANNLNIDLFAYFVDVFYEYDIWQLGVAGNRSACYPETMKCTYLDENEETGKEESVTETYNFKYDTDANGYITKVTVTEGGYKTEYKITYKK